jgi:hypothetical protein
MHYYFVLILMILSSCQSIKPKQKVSMVVSKTAPSKLGINGGFINYYGNKSLTEKSDCIKRAIIVVHGANRNADDYFRYMTDAVLMAKKSFETLVIAPHFKTSDDPLEENEVYWSSQGWRKGNLDQVGLNLSAYDFINKFMDLIEINFSNIEEIVLTGHSAGGQLTQRFVGIAAKDRLIPVRFIPTNLGSYLYFDEYRPNSEGVFKYPWVRKDDGDLYMSDDFALDDTSCERTFNDYKYGLEQRNTMGLSKSSEGIREYYLKSDITYFLGDADTEINEWVDTTCNAMLQGSNRYTRGLNYVEYLKERYPNASHKIVIVPGVAHSAREMYQSKEGIELLFPN